MRSVRAARLVVAALLVIVGAIWFGQGVGWISGSFMTGEAAWAVIGGVCVVAGVALALSARGVRPRS